MGKTNQRKAEKKMTILSTKWTTLASSRCYTSEKREVLFDPSTPDSEIEAFLHVENGKNRGQTDYTVRDTANPFLVVTRIVCDSGD